MSLPDVVGAHVRHEFHASELAPAAWLRVQPSSRFFVYNHDGALFALYQNDRAAIADDGTESKDAAQDGRVIFIS